MRAFYINIDNQKTLKQKDDFQNQIKILKGYDYETQQLCIVNPVHKIKCLEKLFALKQH